MTTQGVILDYTNEQPLPGASVVVLSQSLEPTGRGGVANADGLFTVSAEANEFLKISHVGFSSQTIRPDKNLTVYLPRQGDSLGEVVVTAKAITQEMKTVRFLLRVLIVYITILLLSKLFKL